MDRRIGEEIEGIDRVNKEEEVIIGITIEKTTEMEMEIEIIGISITVEMIEKVVIGEIDNKETIEKIIIIGEEITEEEGEEDLVTEVTEEKGEIGEIGEIGVKEEVEETEEIGVIDLMVVIEMPKNLTIKLLRLDLTKRPYNL
jgi:hypothetical protein